MATDIQDVVDAIHPSDDASGVIIGDSVFVIFNQEIDESSVKEGGLFITGPDNDTWSGPDLAMWDRPEAQTEDEILQSPGFAGVVQGLFSFQRLDLTTTSGVSTQDVTGDGGLYRSKAIFKPELPLAPNTTYSVYLIGDSDTSDDVDHGVRPRSVFDTEQTGTGSDDINFTGTYTGGLSTDVFNIKILNSGVQSVATFEWWLTSNPVDVHGPIETDDRVFLKDGVYVEFGDGIFETDDECTAVVAKQNPFEGSFIWSFTTGTASIQEIPDTTSTSVVGDIIPPPTIAGVTNLELSEITPEDRATNLPLTTKEVVLQFNSDIDPTTVTADSIKMIGLPVNGDEDSLFQNREIYKNITVSGNKITLSFGE